MTDKLFWKYVHPDSGTGCLVWRGVLTWDGYGRMARNHRFWMAHRYAWFLKYGELPVDGLQLDHLCRNRACVNVDHLEAVTQAENMARSVGGVHKENAAKTRCVNGHEFTEANTYFRPNGNRDCRACIRERSRRYQAKSEAA